MTPSGMGTWRLRVTTIAWVSADGKCINRLTRRLGTLMVATPTLYIDGKQPRLQGFRQNSPGVVEIHACKQNLICSYCSRSSKQRQGSGSRGSLSLRVKTPSRRGEGGVEWLGGPLWSPAVPLQDGEPIAPGSSHMCPGWQLHNDHPTTRLWVQAPRAAAGHLGRA